MATTEALSASAGSETVIAEQLDYHQKHFAHPTYKYNAQFSNTFGLSISVYQTHQSPSTYHLKCMI